MADWRDTFERFHDICNQEEARRGSMTSDPYAGQNLHHDRCCAMAVPEAPRFCARCFATEELARAGISEEDMSGAVHGAIDLAASGQITVVQFLNSPTSNDAQLQPGPADRIGAKLDAGYTPTTDTVREAYASECDPLICGPSAVDAKRAEFDRWLASIWQQGADTALDHAIRNDDGITLRLEKPNPYASGRPMTTAEWLKATDEALKP